MRTFFKYAWPVLSTVAIQVFVALTQPAKPGWGVWRYALWLGLDLAIAGLQYWNFRETRLLNRQLNEACRDRWYRFATIGRSKVRNGTDT